MVEHRPARCGGAPSGRERNGAGRLRQHDPAESVPDSGPPHFLPRREGGDIPRASPPGLRPRPLAAAAETRLGHEGPPVWVHFPGLGTRGGIAVLREQRHADRTLSALCQRVSTGIPKEHRHGRPSLAWKVPCVAAVFRGPLSPRCAPPAASGLSTTLRKNAACMHLFIYFATAARNNEAFSRSGPARSPAALLLFSMKLRGRTPRPPRPQPARPAAAPLATESRRRPGHCFLESCGWGGCGQGRPAQCGWGRKRGRARGSVCARGPARVEARGAVPPGPGSPRPRSAPHVPAIPNSGSWRLPSRGPALGAPGLRL